VVKVRLGGADRPEKCSPASVQRWLTGSGQGRRDLSRVAGLSAGYNPAGGENRRRSRMSDSVAQLAAARISKACERRAGAEKCHLGMNAC